MAPLTHIPLLKKPYNHLLDRSGSLSRFYGSVESVRSAGSSIRGKMVKKLCTLFESPKDSSSPSNSKPSPSHSPEPEPLPASKLGSDSSMLFRLAGSEDRIVVYLTSLRGIRRTFEDCNAVRMILRGFKAWVDERDVSMDRAYRKELQVPMLLFSSLFSNSLISNSHFCTTKGPYICCDEEE